MLGASLSNSRVLPALMLLVAVSGFAGYLTGKHNLPRRLARMTHGATAEPRHFQPPGGPPTDVSETSTYAALNGYLNAILTAQRDDASLWKDLLRTTDPAEQRRVVERMRNEFLKLLHPWPGPAITETPERIPWFSEDGVDAFLVDIETRPGVSVSAVLLIPQSADTTLPALLALHGYRGNLQAAVTDIDYHHGFALQLAQQGFVVLAPLRVASTIGTRNTLYLKSLAAGYSLEAIDLHQLVRTVDYLFALPEVDRRRIGVYGISLGGQHALRLGALDERISMVFSTGYFANRFDWLFKTPDPTAGSPPGRDITDTIPPLGNVLFEPGMWFLFDDINLVGMIQPRYLGLQMGTNDPRFASAQQESHWVDRLYAHVGHQGQTSFIPFDGGHEISIETSLPFLRRWRDSMGDG